MKGVINSGLKKTQAGSPSAETGWKPILRSTRSVSLKTRLILLFYNLLFPFVFLGLLPTYLGRMFKRGHYREKFGQRFGSYSSEVRLKFAQGDWIWIHAVSVGEVLIAYKLAQKMKAIRPDLKVALSTTTTTAFALASKSSASWLEIIYHPIDFPTFINAALDLIQPRQIILVEAEVWPNLTFSAHQRGIPLALVNARLSPRSESRFRQFRFFTAPIFQLLDLICVQEPEDLARWKSLGVSDEPLHLTGSIKFDHSDSESTRTEEFRALLAGLGVKQGAPILLAGSTFPDEEKLLAQMVLELRPAFPDLFLIIVPRHIERTPDILAEIQAVGLNCALRTEAISSQTVDCLIVNTIGELRDWYYVGTVIFIGKSLTAIGGQNPVEAVVAGKPVLFGPHMENFQAIVDQWLKQKAAIQVSDVLELKVQMMRLLADPQLGETMAMNACHAIAPHQGATQRTVELLLGTRRQLCS